MSEISSYANKFHNSNIEGYSKDIIINIPDVSKVTDENVSFVDLFKQQLDHVSDLQNESRRMAKSFEAGEEKSLVKVMVQAQKSDIAFEAVVQVRNRLLAAYKEIMSMPV